MSTLVPDVGLGCQLCTRAGVPCWTRLGYFPRGTQTACLVVPLHLQAQPTQRGRFHFPPCIRLTSTYRAELPLGATQTHGEVGPACVQIWGDEKRLQVLCAPECHCEIRNRVAASSVRGEITETAAQHHLQGLAGVHGRGEDRSHWRGPRRGESPARVAFPVLCDCSQPAGRRDKR